MSRKKKGPGTITKIRRVKTNNQMRKKLAGLFFVVLLALVGLAIRITYINATNGEQYKRQVLSQSQQKYESKTISFKRGDILDRNGTILATSEKVYNVILDCSVVNYVLVSQGKESRPYREPTVKALTAVFHMNEEEILKYLDDEATKDSQYIVIRRGITINEKKAFEAYANPEGISDELVDKIYRVFAVMQDPELDFGLTKEERQERANIRGVWFEDDYNRIYPMGSQACEVIGFTYKGNTADWGIEGYYSNVLNGVNGRQYGYYNDDADVEQTIVDAVDGNSVVSTIDINLQQIVRKNMQEFADERIEEYKARKANERNDRSPQDDADGDEDDDADGARPAASGDEEEIVRAANNLAVIVANPKNGEILAMDTLDNYDLNDPTDLSFYYTDDELKNLTPEELVEKRSAVWRNFCVSDAFEPGSTVKPMTVAAGLESGFIDPDDTFVCDGYQQVADKRINCSRTSGHGSQTLGETIMHSCNDAMMQIADKMGPETFLRYQDIFNFGSRTGIDLPGESSGITQDLAGLGSVELATGAFGQGYTCTMIQELAAFSSVINGGYYYQPHVVSQILDSNGSVIKNIEPLMYKQTVSKEVSDLVREYCAKTVQKGGTGSRVKVQGYSMGGKTGTAQKLPRGNGKYILSFIGFAPLDDPQVVIYVVADEPNQVSQEDSKPLQEMTRALFEDILPYLNIFPDEDAQGNPLPDTSQTLDSDGNDTYEDLSVPEPPKGDGPAAGGNTMISEGITNDEQNYIE